MATGRTHCAASPDLAAERGHVAAQSVARQAASGRSQPARTCAGPAWTWRHNGADEESIAQTSPYTLVRAVRIGSSVDDTWVVIPLYNEEKVIGDVVAGVLAEFPQVVCV